MSSSSLPTPLPQPAEVVAFWRDAGPQQWFSKNAAFDAEFRRRFESAHIAAATASWTTGWEIPPGRWR